MKHDRTLPTDRFRGGNAFVETRTGAYYGKVGYLAGLGRSSVVIAEEMGDGIDPSYVRTLLKRWGIPRHDVHCQIPLTNQLRALLTWRAEKRQLTPEQWLAAIAEAAIRDDLYTAIVEG